MTRQTASRSATTPIAQRTLAPESQKITAEHRRLQEARGQDAPWRKWGPYLSERQWGTVREDYSDSGDAWNYFSHDQARSRDCPMTGSSSASHWRSGTSVIRF
jgi:hypothetical protein